MKSDVIREKAFTTNLTRYGFTNPMCNIDIQKKAEDTNMKRYGYKSTAQVPEIRQKMMETLLSHGNIPTSSEQITVYEMLQKHFGQNSVVLNKQVSNVALDVELYTEGVMIDIEYDGQYWYDKTKKSDYARDMFVKSQGYKILRIRSGSKVPEMEPLLEKINELITTDKQFTELYLSDWSSDK